MRWMCSVGTADVRVTSALQEKQLEQQQRRVHKKIQSETGAREWQDTRTP
jgi:hypothetical protein